MGAAPQKRAKAAARKRRTSPACAISAAAICVPAPWRSPTGLPCSVSNWAICLSRAAMRWLRSSMSAGEVADAAGRDLLDESLAEADALESAQLALASEIDNARLADRVDLIPIGAEPLDRLRSVADEAAALQLEQRQGAHELGLERGPELRAFAQHDLRDRDRVTGIGLAGPMAAALAMGAPGGHVEHLVACRFQRRNEEPAV